MTKKHFIALANYIISYPKAFDANSIDLLAHFCASQNDRFNRERWLGYIAGTNGKNGGTIKG